MPAIAAILVILLVALARFAFLFIGETVAEAFSGKPVIAGRSYLFSWLRSASSDATRRWPAFSAVIARRFNPHAPSGLLLTAIVLAAFYLVALFSGLTEDILEAAGTIRSDNAINAALASWRFEPLISIFLWVTRLGNPMTVAFVMILATASLWRQRHSYVVIPFWLTFLGAVTTTTVGKLLVTRHRPETMLDPNATGWSFPSGHATISVALYGFIAYAVARSLPKRRTRFEIAYWAIVLILLIGFSRMLLEAHYFTDVIGGYLVGGFWLIVGIGLTEVLSRRSPGKPPQHSARPESSP